MSLRTTQTSHARCNRCTEHAGNPDSNTDEVSRIGEKPVLDVDPQPVNVAAAESTVPTLRTQRPHPADRVKRVLIGGNALNVSDCLVVSQRFAHTARTVTDSA